MTQDADPRVAFEDIVRGNHYMVLATADKQGNPWATPVWFATEDFHIYYWVSRPDARHSANLAARPEVGVTIFDSHQPAGTGGGVYLAAAAAPVPDDDLDLGLAIFSRSLTRVGAAEWTRSDVTGRARHQLYSVTALERFVLSARDERIRLPG